jgi:N-dimethylarginine dimethylaminohydrolase
LMMRLTPNYSPIRLAADSKLDNETVKTPSQLKMPVFLMNFPLTLTAGDPNNVWMEELEEEEREIDYDKAFTQFTEMYGFIAGGGSLVYLLPNRGNYQDQVYVANLGIYLPHLQEPTIIISNYKSPPRQGEEFVGRRLFRLMKYQVKKPPTTWEGEADLKFLRKNVYLGGYGQRTDPASYDWMTENLEMEIVRVKMKDPRLYHFDCMCFPVTNELVMLATSLMDKKEIKAVEKYAEIIDVPKKVAYAGTCNCCRVQQLILCASSISSRSQDDEAYEDEKMKVDFLTKVATDNGFEPVFFSISEFEKSGAQLSCMIMHLNYHDYVDPVV